MSDDVLFPPVEGTIQYEEQLMAGLAPHPSAAAEDRDAALDNLHHVLQKVDLDLLQPENRALIQCMEAFREETDNAGPLDEHTLLDMLIAEHAPPEIQVKYAELFARYAVTPITPAKFRYCVSRFLKQKEELAFTKAINDAFTIQTSGLTVGAGRNTKQLRGYADAKQFLMERLANIDVLSNDNYVPEGDIREEVDEITEEYEQRKNEPAKFVGVKTGVDKLDEITNGFQPGEAVFIGGYTEVGKTFMVVQAAHYACTVQGFNVAIGTAETIYTQYRRRIALRHARNAAFNLPQGIDSQAFKQGKLTPQEEQNFRAAMADLKDNPNYGRFYLFQVPRGANMAWVRNKLNAIDARCAKTGGLKAFYLDSLALVVPPGKADQKRNVMNDAIKDFKQTGVTFQKGRGLVMVSPWHANRKSWEEAVKNGYYHLASWSEADELEKSADVLFWMLKTDPNNTTSHEILAGLEKYRDGKGHIRFTLYEDFASSYLGTVASGQISAAPQQNVVSLGGQNAVPVETRAKDLF